MGMFVSAEADVSGATVEQSGRSQNEHRTRQAIRGLRDMFRKDGLLK